MPLRPWFDAALRLRLTPTAREWLGDQVGAIGAGADPAPAVAKAGRMCGRALLAPASVPLPGWDLDDLDCTSAARIRLALAIPKDQLVAGLDRLFKVATVDEATALYRGLPAYPGGAIHAPRAAEGVRSNMSAVYEATALGNPYPAAHLDEMAWNQMVLKAFFVGAPANRIVGMEERWNPRLHTMLAGYIHERELARRPIDAYLALLVTNHQPAAVTP
jgi:hypothetical protein